MHAPLITARGQEAIYSPDTSIICILEQLEEAIEKEESGEGADILL